MICSRLCLAFFKGVPLRINLTLRGPGDGGQISGSVAAPLTEKPDHSVSVLGIVFARAIARSLESLEREVSTEPGGVQRGDASKQVRMLLRNGPPSTHTPVLG